VRYDEPPRFDFQEAALAGDASEADVRAFVAALNAGTPGDAKAGLRIFNGRPRDNLVQSYGEMFATALEDTPVGEWRAPADRDGWRAIRLESISAAKPASVRGPARRRVCRTGPMRRSPTSAAAAVRAMAASTRCRSKGAPR
jgi:hypothetical protein